jgi:hypothetical protein
MSTAYHCSKRRRRARVYASGRDDAIVRGSIPSDRGIELTRCEVTNFGPAASEIVVNQPAHYFGASVTSFHFRLCGVSRTAGSRSKLHTRTVSEKRQGTKSREIGHRSFSGSMAIVPGRCESKSGREAFWMRSSGRFDHASGCIDASNTELLS